MGALLNPEIIDGGGALRVNWQDGQSARFHAIWLRDNSLDAATRSQSNGQRLISLSDIPSSTTIESVNIENDELVVNFLPENTKSRFASSWLKAHCYDRASTHRRGEALAGYY